MHADCIHVCVCRFKLMKYFHEMEKKQRSELSV